MQFRPGLYWALLGSALAMAESAAVIHAEPKASEASEKPAAETRLSLEEAKRQAKVMHPVYVATLDAMHHHYFRTNRAVLPARAMEDIFTAVADETQSTAKWISVNTKPMSIDHEPASEFEKQAAIEIAAGKAEYSAVDNGYYRSARPIPLTSGCIGCHIGLGAQVKSPRFAGLVISIPVQTQE